MKINVGSGESGLLGYVNIDRKTGGEAYPLSDNGHPIEDGSCEEIRASHVLEHLPHAVVPEVIKHWAAKLRPGGVLKIAVPDFDWIAQKYLDGSQEQIEGYLMGGQSDEDDFHKSIFNKSTLIEYCRAAGLVDFGLWDADAKDCSALPVSLNFRAVKPALIEKMPKITAVMSMPRTAWTANFRCALEQLAPLGIPLQTFEGVFWGQCLERGFEKLIGDGVEYILTIDYDTVFDKQHIQTLIRQMILHPEADAICPIQCARGWNSVLATMDLPDGVTHDRVPLNLFQADLLKLKTGNFGLTMIRASSLQDMAHPWFLGVPGPDGRWEDGHMDDDIYFWRKWAGAGKTLFAASRVAVGHIEPMIKWPDRNLSAIHQRVADYWRDGPPRAMWK